GGAGSSEAAATIDLRADLATAARETSKFSLAAPAAMGTVAAPVGPGPLTGRIVVLAEPSRTQAGIIRRYLLQLGAAINVTDSGREALELVKSDGAAALVCSMHLKDMTGIQLAQALLADAACSRVGFVLATSETDSDE